MEVSTDRYTNIYTMVIQREARTKQQHTGAQIKHRLRSDLRRRLRKDGIIDDAETTREM